ncbi:MAG TPA: hypothetical protein VKD70_05540 [Candidatus Acidoferrum sp.]|nr:hypothetical protein [Candidatus Acidoferrum sp.]
MGHKKLKLLLGLSFVAFAIVVPFTNGVNHSTQSPIHVADGNPGPPLPPPTDLFSPGAEPIVVADGNPGPPLPPPTSLENQISADQILIADGNPGPPLPPPTELV